MKASPRKAIVGLAKVSKEAYPDPTAESGDWSAVELTAVRTLAKPVSLDAIKSEKALNEIGLLRQSRLSVMPVRASEYAALLKLAGDRA